MMNRMTLCEVNVTIRTLLSHGVKCANFTWIVSELSCDVCLENIERGGIESAEEKRLIINCATIITL